MKTVTLTDEQWDQILDAAESHCDKGPPSQGWQSDELHAAATALREALYAETP